MCFNWLESKRVALCGLASRCQTPGPRAKVTDMFGSLEDVFWGVIGTIGIGMGDGVLVESVEPFMQCGVWTLKGST